jgi:hypothetical protein
MTPQDKANELFEKFKLKPISPIFIMSDEHAKQCVLIAVDEIINNRERIKGIDKLYWQQVKHEIEQL